MNKLKIGLSLVASLWAISVCPTLAAAPPAIRESVAVCDPNSPQHCAAPDSAGNLPITGSISATNPSVGTNAATAPTSSTQIGSVDGTGKLQPASTANPLPALDTNGGAQGTGYNPPAGGSGFLGFLSGIYHALTNTLNVQLQAGTALAGKFGIDQTTPGTTNGVQVNAALPAGTNTIGNVNLTGGNFQLSPTITVQNASYAAGNSLGGLVTVTGAARINGGTGFVDAMRVKSTGGGTETVWIYAWSKTPAATCTDKSAYVSSTSDSSYALPGFPVTGTLATVGSWDTTSNVQLGGLTANFKNQDSSPGTAVYMCIVTATTVTPATTSDISLIVGGVQD